MSSTQPDLRTLHDILALASRAPSAHNTQPWRWRLHRHELRLFADSERAVPTADHQQRQMVLSLGAALDHCVAAAAAYGWGVQVDRLPNPNNPDHLATLESIGRRPILDGHRERAVAMRDRYTDRLPLLPPQATTVAEVVRFADAQNDTHITVLPSSSATSLAEASHLSASLRRYDISYHDELVWWTTRPPSEHDGIPAAALLTPSEQERVALARDFPLVDGGQPRRADIDSDAATVVVLSTAGDARADLLRCGEALSALLIETTIAGFNSCTLSHVLESPESRTLISGLLDDSTTTPQLIVRIGVREHLDETPARSPRRDVDEILTIDD